MPTAYSLPQTVEGVAQRGMYWWLRTVPLPRAEQLYYANPMMFTSNHSHPPPSTATATASEIPARLHLRDFAAHDEDEAAHAALTPNSKARLMRLGRVCCDKSNATSWQCRTGRPGRIKRTKYKQLGWIDITQTSLVWPICSRRNQPLCEELWDRWTGPGQWAELLDKIMRRHFFSQLDHYRDQASQEPTIVK